MDEAMNVTPDKYMITGVRADGEVLWQTEASYVQSISVPIKYRGYRIETLIRDGSVHMRMVGKHKQNSEELRMSVHDLEVSKNHHIIHMNAVLFQLADKLAEEDKLFDEFAGKADRNV